MNPTDSTGITRYASGGEPHMDFHTNNNINGKGE